MTLLTLRDAELAYGDFPLLDHAQLAVQDGERIGLIGRNGTGKSTLLKVVSGLVILDEGAIERRDGLRIAFVEQEPLLAAQSTGCRFSRRSSAEPFRATAGENGHAAIS